MSTRRKPPTSNHSTPSPPNPLKTSPATLSPFLPTRLELLLISIYPLTLLLGSLFSLIAPHVRNAPYNPTLQSHPPEFAPSYFAQKKNVFNVYFVKVGWFWTTLAFFIFILTNPALGAPFRPATTKRVQAAFRYGVITTFWIFTTQWFFGAPLIDRGFRLTGGACEILRDGAKVEEMDRGKLIFTAAACKMAGGVWKGGHDISGHVFLLILGSALLWSEILPAVTHAEGLRDGRRVLGVDGKVSSVVELQEAGIDGQVRRKRDGVRQQEQVTRFGVKLVIGVAALMWWMLLMTAAFFHTWFEKFAGLVVAFGALWTVYYLPRGVPVLRGVLGMPGV